MKSISYSLIISFFLLTACEVSATPTVDVGALQTSAVNTVMAGFNQTSTAGAPTNTSVPTSTPKPSLTPAPDFGTRTSPYPVGMPAHLTQNQILEFNATILEVMRGQQAWDIIYAANQFNNPAPAGMEFVIVKLKIEYVGADQGALQLSLNDFAVVSKGQVIDYSVARPCCLQNELMPSLDLILFAGGVAEGFLAWPVHIDDPSPLLVMGLKSDGSGGIFFSLVK